MLKRLWAKTYPPRRTRHQAGCAARGTRRGQDVDGVRGVSQGVRIVTSSGRPGGWRRQLRRNTRVSRVARCAVCGGGHSFTPIPPVSGVDRRSDSTARAARASAVVPALGSRRTCGAQLSARWSPNRLNSLPLCLNCPNWGSGIVASLYGGVHRGTHPARKAAADHRCWVGLAKRRTGRWAATGATRLIRDIAQSDSLPTITRVKQHRIGCTTG